MQSDDDQLHELTNFKKQEGSAMTGSSPKAQGKDIKRPVLTESLARENC